MTKLLYLAMKNISKKWTLPIRDWKAAMKIYTCSKAGCLYFKPRSHLHK